jgi:hypothetical protein
MSAITSSTWQQGFMSVLPAIETHAKIQFRRLPAERREDAVQEAVASACASYQLLAAKSKLDLAHPSTLASFAVMAVRGGRRVGGRQDAAQDVLSPVARRRHGVRTISFDNDGWRELLLADRRSNVPNLAAFRLDFDSWFSSFNRRDRQIISALAAGERTSAVAERFGISDGRISQLRRRYERDWRSFQGEEAAAAA